MAFEAVAAPTNHENVSGSALKISAMLCVGPEVEGASVAAGGPGGTRTLSMT